MRNHVLFSSLFLTPCLVLAWAGRATPMGEESFGNDPIKGNAQWKAGVLEVVNDTHRVYHSWVNGNESFYFSGTTDDLNHALELFAGVKDTVREVILLPVPGATKTFDGKPVTYNWSLQVPSGIYLAMAEREKDNGVLTRHATVTVHVAGPIDLKKIKIPREVAVLDAPDRVTRGSRGLESKDPSTRGQAAVLLGDFPYVEKAIDSLMRGVADDHEYVKRCAASALARMGKTAKKALPALEKQRDAAAGEVRKEMEQAIAAISSSDGDAAAAPSADTKKQLEAIAALKKKN